MGGRCTQPLFREAACTMPKKERRGRERLPRPHRSVHCTDGRAALYLWPSLTALLRRCCSALAPLLRGPRSPPTGPHLQRRRPHPARRAGAHRRRLCAARPRVHHGPRLRHAGGRLPRGGAQPERRRHRPLHAPGALRDDRGRGCARPPAAPQLPALRPSAFLRSLPRTRRAAPKAAAAGPADGRAPGQTVRKAVEMCSLCSPSARLLTPA